MNDLNVTEYNNVRVLTTQQLANAYGTDNKTLSNNFNNNKDRYIPGKHYICLEGDELRAFKSHSENLGIAPNLNKLYLWTEKGCFLVAKSLNTDKAWEAYDRLIDGYFNIRQELVDRSSLSPQMQLFYSLADSMARTELEQKRQAEKIDAIEQKQNAITDALEPIHKDTWRKDITVKFNRIQRKSGIPFDDLRIDTYKELDRRAGVDIARRWQNRRTRMRVNGESETNIRRLTRMDVIESDRKLKLIYEKILEDYEIRYSDPQYI